MAKAATRPAPNSARTPNTTVPASLDRDAPPIPVWGAPTGITPVALAPVPPREPVDALVPVPPREPVDALVPVVPPEPVPVEPPVPDGDVVVVVVGGDAAAKLLVNVVAQVTVLPPPLAEPSH
jgi:hypothetical protein